MAYHNYKQNLLNHFKDIQPALERCGAEASLNVRNFELELRIAGKTHTLRPQFLKAGEGPRRYTPFFEPDVSGFVGWYPYSSRRWDLSTEKLKFKAYAAANGLTTPEYSVDPETDMTGVVVKKSVSSFSEGIDGPFRRARERPLEAGEFYERFVRGRSAKIYYVEDRPVCLELDAPATVTGDGRRTIGQLLATRAKIRQQPVELSKQARYLGFLGKSLADVLEADAVQQVDFRYGSIFNVPADVEHLDLVKDTRPGLEPQLKTIGARLLHGIPEEFRAGILFTADAILDADGKLWLLEMNSNPYVHPWVYPTMLEALFRAESAPRPDPTQRPSANETFELAVMQFNMGATAQAITLSHRVLQVQPNHAGALYYIGLACAREGRREEGRRALETLVHTAPGDNAYLEAAKQLLSGLGRAARIHAPTPPGAGSPPPLPLPSGVA